MLTCEYHLNNQIQISIEAFTLTFNTTLLVNYGFHIKTGKKRSHWMWFIFPQLKGLGESSTSLFYGIADKEEALAYLNHPILGKRLLEITQALQNVKNKTAFEIFGTPDYLK